ncbi:MAG: DUF2309 domain-containing protein [Planctomycetaceae bacterium]
MVTTTSDRPSHTYDSRFDLSKTIEHAAHLLPAQGPIEVFVHHNTLHAFEHLPFDRAVVAGLKVHGASPYLPEDHYRRQLAVGRIQVAALESVLLEQLGETADLLVASLGTRYALRLAMLQFSLRTGNQAELSWVIAETDALRKFCGDVPTDVRRRTIEDIQRWITTRDTRPAGRPSTDPTTDGLTRILSDLLPRFGSNSSALWNDRQWESFVLQLLWQICCHGVESADRCSVRTSGEESESEARQAVRKEMGVVVNNVLIQFCSSFLDQGFANWELPERSRGFFQTFLSHYCRAYCSPTPWLNELQREATRIYELKLSPMQSICESIGLRGIADDDREAFIERMLLALPGWAGMIWQMETNAEWAVHPAPKGSLTEYLAVRLIAERAAERAFARDLAAADAHDEIHSEETISRSLNGLSLRNRQRAFTVFQLAQVRGWNPRDLHHLSAKQWAALIHELDAFDSLERRRVYHKAYEKKYRDDTLQALLAHNRDGGLRKNHPASRAVFQVVCCIDDREESFRRHVEEVEPRCETFGVAGFFGIAMYYRGVTDAHFRPLCPVNIKPQHFVSEEPVYSMSRLSERQAVTRRRIGRATHQAHLGSRTFLGGLLTGLLGSVAAVPLVARILFPRTASRIRKQLGRIVRPAATQLRIERLAETPGDSNGQLGYSVAEMAGIVEGGLRAIGLSVTERISPLVLICGHGSGSINNPHESAYNCGACSGGRGGPNARAFSQMANDHRVREILAERGLTIPHDTHFVGGYHNTCDDSLTWFDLDLLPIRLRDQFEQAQSVIDEARARSARERCRRFVSASLAISPADALAHVEGRSEDLSQARPEYNHATVALSFVGRRAWSRGLFLDRRSFLTSYDPTQDGPDSHILEQMLRAVIPVCAGISLEYYFSTVDNEAYGCGNKLPHNLTSLLGVMTGAASDLRPGLAAQMVEIHEPMRLLFVIETTPDTMMRIIDDNPPIAQLIRGDWVQLAVYQPDQSRMDLYRDGRFVPIADTDVRLPRVSSSEEWFGGRREHLGFAAIETTSV